MRRIVILTWAGGQEEDCQPFEVGWEGVTVECSQFEDGKFE